MSLYIRNATYIDWKDLTFTPTDIGVEEGPGGGILFHALGSAPPEGAGVIDAKNAVVLRAFGCGHHHIYSTLARGMPAPPKNPKNFVEILKYVWWRLDKNLDLDMIRASALASAVFCAKNGVTFVIDHHASPFGVAGSLSVIKDAFDRVGISHLLCYEISDRDGEAIAQKGLDETREFLSQGNQGHVGLHASFTVPDPLLARAVDLADRFDTGIHIHVAEDRADQDHCMATYGKRVVQRLWDAGALALKGTLLGHCVHLDETEKKLVQQSQAWVVQNTESNLNNNVGLGSYTGWGDRIMLGTDGMHSDMLRSAKASFFAGQGTEGLDFPGIYRRFRNIHQYTKAMGAKGDSENNLVILDYNAPTHLTPDNFLGHFVFGIDASHVRSVISSGRLIVEDRTLLTADEAEIMAFARDMGDRLWKKLG